jgi:hypothetical protein
MSKQHVEIRLKERAQGRSARQLLLGMCHQDPNVVEERLDDRLEELLLGRIVVIQRRLGDAEPFRDLAQAGLAVPLLGKELGSHRADSPTGCLGLVADHPDS